jgi:hypothetical protein
VHQVRAILPADMLRELRSTVNVVDDLRMEGSSHREVTAVRDQEHLVAAVIWAAAWPENRVERDAYRRKDDRKFGVFSVQDDAARKI